jgi:glycosyltransferase involved in cell wall biosynthesis
MLIGIDGSRAFLDKRTGIEEYSYQVIRHLVDELHDHEVVLYVRKSEKLKVKSEKRGMTVGGLELPENWKVKVIRMPRLWTQVGLAWEMLVRPVDALFVPAHTAPWIHPKNTVVAIHGLEYEFCPGAYSFWERLYMRLSIRMSCRWAKRIISVSENTKWDLVQLYGVSEKKVNVVYEGYAEQPITKNSKLETEIQGPYLLFVGRIEERKNIINTIDAFEMFKEIYGEPHKLILAGRPGFGYDRIKNRIMESKFREDIVELGFVSEDEKAGLLRNAAVFSFVTSYEGFGIPILEAQSMGIPVVAGRNSSIPEVAGDGAVLVDSRDSKAIARAYELLISDRSLCDDMKRKGLENAKRFSWSKCAKEIAGLLNR